MCTECILTKEGRLAAIAKHDTSTYALVVFNDLTTSEDTELRKKAKDQLDEANFLMSEIHRAYKRGELTPTATVSVSGACLMITFGGEKKERLAQLAKSIQSWLTELEYDVIMEEE